MAMNNIPITPQTLVRDLLDHSPQMVVLFLEKKLGCVGCAMTRFCTLQDLANYYGMTVNNLIEEAAQVIRDSEKSRG